MKENVRKNDDIYTSKMLGGKVKTNLVMLSSFFSSQSTIHMVLVY